MKPAFPFGTPEVLARPIVTTVPAVDCAGPSRLYRRLRAASDTPVCLLESSDPDSRTAQKSIIAARCPLRTEIRGDAVRTRLLEPAAAPLLAALQRRLPRSRRDGDELVATYPPLPRGAALDDDQRLRSECVLDGLRATAGLVGDDHQAVIAPGLFGAFGYEIVDRFEDLPPRAPDPRQEPDASFVLATDQVLFDHRRGEVQVITRRLGDEDAAAAEQRHARYLALLAPTAVAADQAPHQVAGPAAHLRGADVTDARFCADVRTLQDEIRAGEIFQAVLSRGFEIASDVDPLDVYAELRRHNPSPYMFHLDLAEGCLLGASPETFLRCEDGQVEIRPIAGTVPRGRDADADRRLALQLLLDPKEQAEHAMLLDLARNDVARVAEPGSCEVVQQFEVEKYSHVQHLVSRVRGRLRAGFDALHAYRAAANMGTLTGAPKLRAMESIRRLEPQARGFYGGAAGYLLQDGRFDSCIVIRSLRYAQGVYHTRAGAGVVLDSDPTRELRETHHKAQACIEAVRRAAGHALEELAS